MISYKNNGRPVKTATTRTDPAGARKGDDTPIGKPVVKKKPMTIAPRHREAIVTSGIKGKANHDTQDIRSAAQSGRTKVFMLRCRPELRDALFELRAKTRRPCNAVLEEVIVAALRKEYGIDVRLDD